MSDVELDMRNLKKLKELLKASKSRVRIGVLGSSPRSDKGPTNAEVGAFAEFGTATSPIRSWLRMPITTRFAAALENSGAFEASAVKQVIRDKSLVPWLTKIGIVAEGVVAEAFDTGGWGQWPPSDMRYKKNHQTLVETQQLRNAVTSEVKE